MPIHDWTRVVPRTFHPFHNGWIYEMQGALNNGVLPPGFYALAEQPGFDVDPDVLALRVPVPGRLLAATPSDEADTGGGLAVASAPPTTAVQSVIPSGTVPANRSRRLVVRHTSDHDPVAVIEVVSPANKRGRIATGEFIDKAVAIVEHGIHLQVLDLFPPGRSNPDGTHAAIWTELGGEVQPALERPLTLASYVADVPARAYVEPSAVGMSLVTLPLFLTPQRYVNVPLEATYTTAYGKLPAFWRDVIEGRTSA